MKYFLLPFRIIYKIYYLIVFAFSLIITYPIYYYLLAKPSRYSRAFSIMRIHAKALLFFAGVWMNIKGYENIPKNGVYIICTNHSSFLDNFCIYSLFKQYFVFIGKKEIEKWPLFHIFYTSGMNILIDRSGGAGSITALKRMSQELQRGNPLAIFPEGTRSKISPTLVPFKSGAFAIAIKNQVPILPITFVTNWKRLQSGSLWKGKAGPGVSEVVVHKLVQTQGLSKNDVEKLKEDVEQIISGPFAHK